MALLTCDFFSDALQVGTSMTVVLPQRTESQIGVEDVAVTGPSPVLYLLHGLSDDHTAWSRYTSIGRYAEAAGLAVVMPAVHRSFYANESSGHRYWDFVSEELPEVVRAFFQVSHRPEDTFVAGLSMGGYGALRLALTHPARYAAAASMSGALDIVRAMADPARAELSRRVFGDSVAPDEDLFSLLGRAAVVPPLHLSCGREDPLLDFTTDFAETAVGAGHDVTLDLRPGAHEWAFWDDEIQRVLAWLPLRRG
ncbi:MAG: alpha/beta hydrolase family protein [Nocardioides sp.]